MKAQQRGFSFVEIMVAVVLLAVCAVPAADAIRNGLHASAVVSRQVTELRCVRNQMEAVLAEPYQKLWSAARGRDADGRDIKTSYSKAKDNDCKVDLDVYIRKYEHEYGKEPVVHPDTAAADLDTYLLLVTVASPDTAYTFSTLVAR